MSALNAGEIAKVAHQAGFRGKDLETAVAVALAESGGRPEVNAAGAEDSRGLWQINSVHFGRFDADRLSEPGYNAKAAHAVWRDAGGFGPWTAYRTGAHRSFLDDAARAVQRRPWADSDGRGGGSRPGQGQQAMELRPWRLPSSVVGRAGRIVVDPTMLQELAREFTGHLATVQGVYHRCRQHADALDIDKITVSHSGYERRLKAALTEAIDDWYGLRRLPDLLARDVGMLVDARERALGADRGDRHARRSVEQLISSLRGSQGDAGKSTGARRTAELLRLLYRPDHPRGDTLPTTPRARGDGNGGVPAAPGKIDLRRLTAIADKRFNLTIREYAPYDRVDPVHTQGSFHYRGRAFDASGNPADLARFANWAADHYGKKLTELFWNGPHARNIDNGHPIPRGTVPGHTDHVHIAL
ncbi:MAG: hypothetical protein ACRDTC_17710 [Pseudonocardiaceae bacterium]